MNIMYLMMEVRIMDETTVTVEITEEELRSLGVIREENSETEDK